MRAIEREATIVPVVPSFSSAAHDPHTCSSRMSAVPREIAIATPVYDDWASAALLLERLDGVLLERGITARVLVVDDGSSDAGGASRLAGPYRALRLVEVLRLARNLGHQRAIAIGLSFLHQERPPGVVVVMDADGEDRAEDVPVLLDALDRAGGKKVVFAERARRSEGVVFRAGYQAYRVLHRVLTGIAVRVGNFSAVPQQALASYVVVSEAWNHYAAAVFKARIPYTMVPIARGERLAGRSTMRLVGLVTHGMSAISVFGEAVGVRLLLAGLAGFVLSAAACVACFALREESALAASALAWSAYALFAFTEVLVVAFVIAFTILSSRNGTSFLPARDYRWFVARVVRCFPPETR